MALRSAPPHRGSCVVGVDLGATKLAAACVGPDGLRYGPRVDRRHDNPRPPEMIRDIAALVAEVRAMSGSELGGVGVGIAAQVRARDGSVAYAPNLGWSDVPLAADLASRLGVPVVAMNDARAATLGVWRHGVGRGQDDLLVVLVGTGVGGSAVSGGRLLGGASDAFGEVGHSVLVAGGRKCHCPGRGCLEAYVGGWAIAERAAERVAAGGPGSVGLRRAAGTIGRLDARAVRRAADAGDETARGLVEETGRWLAWGVAGLVNALNPRLVALGGGIVDAFPEFLPVVRTTVRTHCQPVAARTAGVWDRAIDPDSVLVGAATRVYERLGERRPGPTPTT